MKRRPKKAAKKSRKRATKRAKKTPIRDALETASTLRSKVEDGIGALANSHRRHLDSAIRNTIGDSLDLDEAMQPDHPQENRWDYLLGHTPSVSIVALEPHSAKQDQITKIIDKKKAARQQLSGQLKPGKQIADWIWVASSKVFFADTEKVRLRLNQQGIRFAASPVLKKHLPDAKPTKRGPR